MERKMEINFISAIISILLIGQSYSAIIPATKLVCPPATFPEFCQPESAALFSLPSSSRAQTCCGYNFTLIAEKANWMDAVVNCKRYGMELVSVETTGKYDCLIQLIRLSEKFGPDNFWTSANDIYREGRFTWLTSGAPVTNFINSGPNQPDNAGGNEHCVSLRKEFGSSRGTQYVMNDEVCTNNFMYICEQKLSQ